MSSDQYMFVKKIHPLERLQAIERHWGFLLSPGIAIEEIKFLKREFKFLDIFPRLQSFNYECGMQDVTQEVQTLFDDVIVDLNEIYKDPYPKTKFDPLISQVKNKIWITKLDIRAKYSFQETSLWPSANKDGAATSKIILEFVDAVVEILGDLVQTDDPSSLLYVPEPKDQIKEILKELKLLRFFVYFVSIKCIEPQSRHTFFSHVLIVAGHTAIVVWLYLASRGNRNDQDLAPSEMNALLSDLMQMKIKPIQPGIRKIYIDVLQDLKSAIQSEMHPNIQNKHAADSGFVETLAHDLVGLPTSSNACQVFVLNDQMAILQEILSNLRDILIHLPTVNLDFCLQDMDTVIVDAGFLIYSLYDIKGEKEDTMLEDINRALNLDLPSNIVPIKSMIYLIVRKAFPNLRRIHGLGYVDFFLNNLKEFQGRYANSLVFIKNQLQIIQKELESLQPFLKAVAEEQHHRFKTLQVCATQLISKAYEVEYVVDAACISKEIPNWCLKLWLLDIIEEITRIKAEVAEIPEKQWHMIPLILPLFIHHHNWHGIKA
ncbi:late blight resistance protein R1-A-like [Nicotiana sylvestris]|uniref:late blight resistance protein R1-A-like n=1 Tax=Nicotiana sylvestris TaxID=4096 RepID=UPI00388C9B3F